MFAKQLTFSSFFDITCFATLAAQCTKKIYFNHSIFFCHFLVNDTREIVGVKNDILRVTYILNGPVIV